MIIDPNIVIRCQQNESDAQREIYQILAPGMFGVCMRYASSRAEAEDYLHDGFIHLFKKIDMYRAEGSFEGWARRIFITTALSHIRKRKNLTQEIDSKRLEQIPSQMPEVLESMQNDEIIGYISKLPPSHRSVLNLYSIEGYSHQEIADELGITPENSRVLLLRAKAKLARYLTQAGLL